MEETPTPWLITEAVDSSALATRWVWIVVLAGVAAVVLGGILFSV